MFTAYCPAEGTEVLLTYGRLRKLTNTPQGIELTFACWCGEELHVTTGALARCA